MAGSEDVLTRAHTRVSIAGDELGRREGFDASAVALKCRLVVGLLEDCGATPSADPEVVDGAPALLLREAAELLDSIPADERPLRLGAARAALAGALLAVTTDL